MRFASLLSGGFITMTVVNPPEMKLAKCSSDHLLDLESGHPLLATGYDLVF